MARDADGWRAEFRIPFSQLRFQPDRRGHVRLRRSFAQIGRLNETSTWPLLSKNASGYVSSFGELTGLQLDRLAEAARAGALRRRARSTTQPVEAGQPLAQAHRSGCQRRPRSEVRAAARADADRHGQSRLRPGRSRSRRRQPDRRSRRSSPSGGRSSSKARASSASTSTATTAPAAGSSTRAASAARRAARPTCRRAGTSTAPDADDDHRRREADRPHRRVLGRRAERGHRATRTRSSPTACVHTRQTVEPLTSYSVRARPPRVRQPVGARLHARPRPTGTSTTRHAFPARAGVHGRPRLGLAAGQALRHPGLLGGQQRAGRRGGDRRAAGEHRPQLPAARRRLRGPRPDADLAQRLRAAAGARARSAAQRVRFTSNVGVKSPGFDSNDVGFMRRADQRTMSNWLQWRNDTPNKYLRSFRFNLNQWAGWNFGGDLLNSGGNVNAHGCSRTTGPPAWASTSTPRRSTTARRAAGRARYRNPQQEHVGLSVDATSARRVGVGINIFDRNDGQGTSVCRDFSPERHVAALVVPRRQRRPELSAPTTISRSGSRNRRRPLRLRPHRPARPSALTTRVNYTITPRLSIQIYAQPFVSAGRLHDFKELVDGRAPRVRGPLPPFDYRGQPRLQLPLVPHHQRAALGVPARLDAVRRLAAGPRRRRSTPARSTSAATSAACSTPRRRNVFLVKWAYWLNY